MIHKTFLASAGALLATAGIAAADLSTEAGACIDALRAETGGLGGEITHEEFSQAGTFIQLRDANGTNWECIAYSDGTVGELRPAGGGGGSAEPQTTTQQVHFDSGSSGAEINGVLTPGSSARYVLGAREGQNLYVRVAHRDGPRLDFQIFNPDGSFLLDLIPTDREYRGQLWQSGDHVVEVVNRGGATAGYSVIFGID